MGPEPTRRTQQEIQRQLGRPCDCLTLVQKRPPLWFDLRDSPRSEGWRGGSALSLAEVGRTRRGVGVGEQGKILPDGWDGDTWALGAVQKCGNGSEEFPK